VDAIGGSIARLFEAVKHAEALDDDDPSNGPKSSDALKNIEF
jgi:hypothetical protein